MQRRQWKVPKNFQYYYNNADLLLQDFANYSFKVKLKLHYLINKRYHDESEKLVQEKKALILKKTGKQYVHANLDKCLEVKDLLQGIKNVDSKY